MTDKTKTYPWEKSMPPTVNWRAEIPACPLTEVFDKSVKLFPNRPCTEFLGKHLTYREVAELTNRLTKGLQQLGIRKGTRVGLLLPNCPTYLISFYAILKAGGTVVNFSPLCAKLELERQISDSGIECMITLNLNSLSDKIEPFIGRYKLQKVIYDDFARMLPFPKNVLFHLFKRREISAIKSDKQHVLLSEIIKNNGKSVPVSISPHTDIAVLQYTGGTTGEPKGAMLTHANLFANTEQSAICFPKAVPGQEKVLCVIPFFHVFSMTAAMNLGLRLGAELIMLPHFDKPLLMSTIHKKHPTLFPAVPSVYATINTYKNLEKYNLRSIKFCISGGSPLPAEVKRIFEKNSGCILVEGYGLTEASPVVTVNPPDGTIKEGSIGLPLPGTIVEIRSAENPTRIMPTGEKGELCVRGPQVMKEYWNRPTQTNEAFIDGFLRTGDIAYMDNDGYVFLVDRIKDVIINSGYNVYPRNIEEAVYMHPSVFECVAIGVPEPYRGQVVKLLVKIAPDKTLTKSELLAFLKDKLSSMEMPRYIEFRDTLPKTLIGKIDRKALMQEEAERKQKLDNSK